jgi:hypothetical protein
MKIEHTTESVDENISKMKAMRVDSQEKEVKTIGECGDGAITFVTILLGDVLTPKIMREDGEKGRRGWGK